MSALANSPATHMVKLAERRQVADGTMAFLFSKPSGFDFKAGQSVDMTLLNPPETDSEGNTRSFSLASAPEEKFLMIATRMRDTAFKRALRAIPLQTEVQVQGPFGNLTLHNKASRPAVLLAGGIGITPFRSMVVHAAEQKLPHRIFLFYSNRRPEDAAFLDELRAMRERNPNFTFVGTMTQMEKSHTAWEGATGFVDKAMLASHLTEAESAIYYIAGPPPMVAGLHAMLNQSGIDDDDIRTEEFAGY